MTDTLTDNTSGHDLAASGSARATRIFGWLNLTLLGAFILNAILTFWFDWPGLGPALDGGGWTSLALMQGALYAGAFGLAVLLVVGRERSLRDEALLISDANAFLIRAAFWAVLFVGLADAAISFLRVEGFLVEMVGAELAGNLSKSTYRGLWVHVPLMILGIVFAMVTRTLGFLWLALLVVAAELLIVFSRFIFSYEQAFMADLVRFWYAALFLFASAHTLLEDGHVRVDVLYAGFRRRARGRVNALGSVLLGMSLCWCIILLGMWGKFSIIVSPILVFETTQTGFGMYVKYMMAGFLGIFGISMMLQFVSSMFDSVADWRNDPGGKPETDSAITH